MARRGPNEGSIYERNDGRWAGSMHVGYREGKRVRKTVYGKTRREVQTRLQALLRDQQQGLPITPDRLTVSQFLTDWLIHAEPTIKPRTHISYRQLINSHVVPSFGRKPIAKLSPQDLAALYARKLSEGLSPGTVEHLHAVLHRSLKQAMKWGVIVRNPADAVDAPRARPYEIKPLSADQARTLLDALRGDPWKGLYVLALTTGMRQGELLGLKWSDVDRVANQLTIRHTLQRIEGEWRLETPKTAKSRRTISLSPVAVRALRAHHARQAEARLFIGPEWQDWDLVFTRRSGLPVDGRRLGLHLHPPLERNALPRIRFHDLRHSAATLLLGEGVHPKVVQDLLGHSTIALTLDVYSHVLPNMHRDAATKMGHAPWSGGK